MIESAWFGALLDNWVCEFQASIGLPDIHSGYGFAIGNIAAFDVSNPEAVVSPGGFCFANFLNYVSQLVDFMDVHLIFDFYFYPIISSHSLFFAIFVSFMWLKPKFE